MMGGEMVQVPIFCKTYEPADESNFWRYPSHKVLAVFEEPESVSMAINELRNSQIDEEGIEVFCGKQGES